MNRKSNILTIFCCVVYFASKIDSAAACNRYEKRCANGQCIRLSQFCDGIVHCSDKSDETVDECIGLECPGFSFRCAYGACVRQSAECNNVQDCADNSDELSPKCPAKQYGALNGTCQRNMFQCDNGQCIDLLALCDGRADCGDESDEMVQYCASSPCPSYAFRCGYGACIAGSKKCDGKTDCFDASDETKLLCNYTESITRPPKTNTRPTMTWPTATWSGSSTSQRPPSPSNGSYCCVHDISGGDAYFKGEVIEPGRCVPNYHRVDYRCRTDIEIDGAHTNHCLDGKWQFPAPTCSIRCDPEEIFGLTILANCYRKNGPLEETVDCRDAIEPGTYAAINCKLNYQAAEGFRSRVTCGSDGQWSPKPGRCAQVCGLQGSIGRPFIVGGYESNIAEVPWHAGIYQKKNMVGNTFDHICGGSIISAKLVLSAIHCFWDNLEDRVHDRSIFQVAVGKSRRGYNDQEEYPIQTRDIDKLLFDEAYTHERNYYVADIVVIVMDKYIEFQTYISPVCVKWDLNYEQSKVPPGIHGKVAGWGLTESGGNPSPVLKAIDMPTVDRDECVANSPVAFVNAITFDKFCAGYLTGVSVCQGDSGGGLVFPEKVGRKTVYYLRGIVSVGVKLQSSCDNYRYATFTNINRHLDIVRYHFNDYQPKL